MILPSMIPLRIRVLAAVIVAASSPGYAADGAKADLLFFDGTVLTPQGTAQAVAVGRGVILAVSSNEDVGKVPSEGAQRTILVGVRSCRVSMTCTCTPTSPGVTSFHAALPKGPRPGRSLPL